MNDKSPAEIAADKIVQYVWSFKLPRAFTDGHNAPYEQHELQALLREATNGVLHYTQEVINEALAQERTRQDRRFCQMAAFIVHCHAGGNMFGLWDYVSATYIKEVLEAAERYEKK